MPKPIVGKIYKTASGNTVIIIKENKGRGFPFVADDGENYDCEGHGYHGSRFDLIFDIEPVTFKLTPK